MLTFFPMLTFSPSPTFASLIGSAAGLHCEALGFPTSFPRKLSGKRKNLVVAFSLALSIGRVVSATIFHLCILRYLRGNNLTVALRVFFVKFLDAEFFALGFDHDVNVNAVFFGDLKEILG